MSFALEEATVADIHRAYSDGQLSCRELVQAYLGRIDTIDRTGASLNAVVTVNPAALDEADRFDAALAETGSPSGPLHGIPLVVKDQAETAGIPTSFGSVAMQDYIPHQDATAIAKLKDAGAIVLAKTTMPDFASSWFSYSSRSGTTRNPYALDHDPGGSSSGTGAAVAANLATLGVGEDTGGSIRLPASFNNLVGLKVTPGLISRAGMSPLVTFQDSAGPMCRTVADTARLLSAMVGFDAQDPFTATATIAGSVDYLGALEAATLKGKTIAVLRQVFGDSSNAAMHEVNQQIENSLAAMTSAGATVIDIEVRDLDHDLEFTSLYVTHSRHDIDQFLRARESLPFHSVKALHAAGLYHKALDLFEMIVEGPEVPTSETDYFERYTAREAFQRKLINAMANVDADAIAFPTTQLPAPSRESLDRGDWTTFTFPTNTLIAAQSWMPALSLPAGFTSAGLPVGLELVGLPYREADLLALAAAVEAVTHQRRAPSGI